MRKSFIHKSNNFSMNFLARINVNNIFRNGKIYLSDGTFGFLEQSLEGVKKMHTKTPDFFKASKTYLGLSYGPETNCIWSPMDQMSM